MRHGLLQQFQLLGPKIGANGRQPRGISTGSREARHVPDADGIGMGVEHDGDRPGRLPGRLDHRRRGGDDDVDVHADQFGCEVTQLLDALRPAELDDNGLALDVAEIAQPRPQRFHLARSRGSGGEMQIPDPSNLCRLRPRRERPRGRRTAEQRDELAARHSITSSARAMSVDGISMPSMRAVCALMTSSNLADCSTGKSAGLAPLRMRPTYTAICRYVSTMLVP